jgi:hypothetical protein
MKALNTSVVEYIVLLQVKDISRHRILFSRAGICSCNGYQLQTASCFVERERE